MQGDSKIEAAVKALIGDDFAAGLVAKMRPTIGIGTYRLGYLAELQAKRINGDAKTREDRLASRRKGENAAVIEATRQGILAVAPLLKTVGLIFMDVQGSTVEAILIRNSPIAKCIPQPRPSKRRRKRRAQ